MKTQTVGNGRGAFIRGWKKQQPGYHQKTNMMKTCGKKYKY
jgi:hypothetical protein